MRILSLLPSATEIVCALGLYDQLVGVTHACDFPVEVLRLPKVTHTKIPAEASSREIDSLVREKTQDSQSLYALDHDLICQLEPDLIITQQLCDVCAIDASDVQQVVKRLGNDVQVVNLEPTTLKEVFDSILLCGDRLNVADGARELVNSLQQRVQRVTAASQATGSSAKRIVFVEWLDPPFVAGHWNPELVTSAGGIELLGKVGGRSVQIAWDKIAQADPDAIVVACCGFDEARGKQELAEVEKLDVWQQLRCVKDGNVHVLDGSAYFNRPGPRLVDGLELLADRLKANRDC